MNKICYNYRTNNEHFLPEKEEIKWNVEVMRIREGAIVPMNRVVKKAFAVSVFILISVWENSLHAFFPMTWSEPTTVL